MKESRLALLGMVQRWLWCLAICALACAACREQAKQEKSSAAKNVTAKIRLRGCVGKWTANFSLATATPEADVPDGVYALTGNTAGFEKYIGRELVLEGLRGQEVGVQGFDKPFPGFSVEQVVEVVPRQTPRLSPAFLDRASWREEKYDEHGVKFAHPAAMEAIPVQQEQAGPVGSNFVNSQGMELVGEFNIPDTTYAKTNFRGGRFAVFVNDTLNRTTCNQFNEPSSEEPGVRRFATQGTQYAETVIGSAAMGQSGTSYAFHTFQNEVCYEIAFDVSMFSAHNSEAACNVPLLSEEDEMALMKPLLESVAYFPRKISEDRN